MEWEWALWFLLVIVSLLALEAYALRHPDRMNTLSETVSSLGERFPLSIFIIGVGVGILSYHFWAAP